jgi:class 3 adenylate cyclase/tetratricopeptide (TPR) repeat protein
VPDRARILQAIEAQEQLRGTVPDDVLNTTIAALRAQLDDAPATTEEPTRRRQGTVLFADVAGYTAYAAGLDAEVVARVMNDLWTEVDQVIRVRGGRIEKHIGDAVLAVWGVDGAREDDPERAVRAALDLRDAFERFRAEQDLDVSVRIGVNTGPVVFGPVGTTGEHAVTGDAVNVASRVEGLAPPGTVLVTHDTFRHVRGVFDVQACAPALVKGKSEPLVTYVVEQAKARAFDLRTRGVEGVETAMVGRTAEMAVLQDAYRAAVEDRTCRMVTVVGEPGAGKSRLLHEFVAWLDLRPEGVYYLKGRAVPDLRAVPRGVLRELFAFRFEVFDDDPRPVVSAKLRAGLSPLGPDEAEVLGHWLGFDLGDPPAVHALRGSPDFGRVATAHLTDHLRHAAAGPSVLLIEDAHWADDESLDAVEHVAAGTPLPLLVVAAARPELADRRAGWGTSLGDRSAVVGLGRLTTADADRLVRDILRRVVALPDPLVSTIVDHADGNPFYIEEIVKMLLDDGVVVAAEDAPWRVVGDIADLDVPPSLAGVLQSRLDGLRHRERAALQHAAVVGRTFWDDALAALLTATGPRAVGPVDLAPTLGEVRRRELVTGSDRSTFAGSEEYRFKHALLRDATYDTVLLADRGRLHSAAADWLRIRAGDRLDEHLGPLAEHLVRAGRTIEAAEVLERAARRATGSGAPRTAANLLRQAIDLHRRGGTADDEAATTAMVDLGAALCHTGDYDEAGEWLTEGLARAEQGGDVSLAVRARCAMAEIAMDRGEWAAARALIEEASTQAEHAGVERLGEALHLAAWLEIYEDRIDVAAACADRAMALRPTIEDRDLVCRITHVAGVCSSQAGDFDEGRARFEEAIDIARRAGNPSRRAMVLGSLGVAAHLRAGTDTTAFRFAIDAYAEARTVYARLGVVPGELTSLNNLVQAEIEAGDLDHARSHLAEALARTWDVGHVTGGMFALLLCAELAIATGAVERGLALLGAQRADPRAEPNSREVDRILDHFGIGPERAAAGMAAGAQLALDELVPRLIAELAAPPPAGVPSATSGA